MVDPDSGICNKIEPLKFSIAGIICGILSFFIFHILIAIIAIIFSVVALYKRDKMGIIGIIIAVCVIWLNYTYFQIGLSYPETLLYI